MSNENHIILDEVNQAKSWFPAVKVAPVWAKQNTATQTISSPEGETVSRPGDIICRGPDGEKWTQSATEFHEKYEATGETDQEGYEKYLPKPEKGRVMAAKVDHHFKVTTSWGELDGKPGDFLIKPGDDRDVEYPASIWIVGEAIFLATYERI